MNKSFDWTLVKSFLAVLDAGSLMAAARATGMQQPTLSRHVAELEAQLGLALFERTGRGAVPTAAALGLAPAARQMQEGALQLAQTLSARARVETGTVRISTSQVAASWLLPPLLAQWARAQPGIGIELVASNGLSNLLRREADIAVRMLRPTQAGLLARKLGEVSLGVYAHESYLQRHAAPRQPEDLAQARLIGYDRDATVLEGFARMGLPRVAADFCLRTDDQVAYGQLVAQGAGIGFLANYHAAQLPGLRRLLPQLPLPPLPCWLVVHREIRGNPLVRKVFDHLAEHLPPILQAPPSGLARAPGAKAARRKG